MILQPDSPSIMEASDPQTRPIYRILPVTELCENVLQHLSFHDLIRVQFVCRDLNATIQGSFVLQEKLFLKPTPSCNGDQWVADIRNRLFVGEQARAYLSKSRIGSGYFNSITPILCNPILISNRNSYVLNAHSKTYAVANTINDHADRPYHPNEYFFFKNEKQSFFQGLNSRCRSMFLTQPPATMVELEPEGRCRHSRRADQGLLPEYCRDCLGDNVIANPSGVTIGQVVDEICHWSSRGYIERPRKIRFPGAFVVSKELIHWAYEKPMRVGF